MSRLRLLALGLTAGLVVVALGAPAAVAQPGALEGGRNEAPAFQEGEDGPVEFGLEHQVVRGWSADEPNRQAIDGRLTLDGRPVAGARLAVNGYRLPEPTDDDGHFTYPADLTLPLRYEVRVRDTSGATLGGEPLTDAQHETLANAEGEFSVGYAVTDVEVEETDEGLRVTGSVLNADGEPPPAPILYSYRVRGVVSGADGEPLADRTVVWRSPEFDTWTIAETGEDGAYEAYLWPNSATVTQGPFRVVVAQGDEAWAPSEEQGGVLFDPLTSAVVDIGVPDSPDEPLQLPERGRPEPGAYWRATLVGVTDEDGEVVTPLEANWLSEEGELSLLLPSDLSGSEISFWTRMQPYFSEREVAPGAPIEEQVWPEELGERVPRHLAEMELP